MKQITTFLFCVLFLSAFTLRSQSRCDTLFFQSQDAELVGYFYPSGQSEAPTFLFTQGFMETGDPWGLCEFLSSQGVNVFTFDFRGCFGSQGAQGLMNGQEDIASAVHFLASEKMRGKYGVDTATLILGGYSYGGHMSMLYAVHHPEVKRVASISGGDLGAFARMLSGNPHLLEAYAGFFETIKKPEGPVNFEWEKPLDELLQNAAHFDLAGQVAELSQTDVFMTAGLDDAVVSLEEQLLPVYRNLKRNKGQSVVMKVYNCSHSYKGSADQMKTDLAAWIVGK